MTVIPRMPTLPPIKTLTLFVPSFTMTTMSSLKRESILRKMTAPAVATMSSLKRELGLRGKKMTAPAVATDTVMPHSIRSFTMISERRRKRGMMERGKGMREYPSLQPLLIEHLYTH